ncbi:hypothetical protein T12_8190 [Trichinella patagoniensis]|nr:hypothetical protein T12_8190 [Trichinella patagoniensis]
MAQKTNKRVIKRRYYQLVSIFHRLGQHRPNGSIASVHVQNKRYGEIRVFKYQGAHQQVLQRCEGSLLAGSPLPFLTFPCEFMEWACDTGKVIDVPPVIGGQTQELSDPPDAAGCAPLSDCRCFL